ncbi:protein Shroom2-like isoform X2 [Poecilia reticulata]|uniref:protein Shroom2-like isoform X2 n=1 Tax=Poecilia reticulata TaxID=8081 RepID=UPI0004A2A8F8|nr:PREDICTED: protein Shroom2-like isoform X2 [Poecilia reticulata]
MKESSRFSSALGIKRDQKAEMVDVVSRRTMPSENEVHVARNFLSKILRSSMRKNRFKGKHDPGVRPHSWHSSKLTEEESEPAGSRAATAPLWQPQHEARSKESTKTEKTQHSNQLSSVDSMERLERPSPPYPPGCLSPPQYMDGSEPFSGSGAKRDSAFSCFSGSSSPPVFHSSMSGRKGTSTENIFFKGLQSEGSQQNERHRFLQPALGNGGWQGPRGEEQPASRVSAPGRAGVGPMWQVPEKKKPQSPPPPPLPLYSDSFAAAKVFPYSEGPTDSHGNSFEKLTENNQNCLRFQNQLHPNKFFSLSSSDVSQPHYVQSPAHHRQCSDESPFYLQTRTAPPTQSVGSYYRSLQDLPSNAFSRKHTRHSTAAMTGQDSRGHSRHLGPSGHHPMQTGELKARQSKAGGWRGETEKSQQMNCMESGFHSSLKANAKAKHPTPQSQIPHCENQDHNGNGVYYETSLQSTEEPSKRASDEMKTLHQSIDHKVGLSRHQDPWMPQEDHRISNLKTPLLHFLAQENQTLAERQAAAPTTSLISTEDVCETTTNSGKASRRSDRYATTLRKEIQQKRAQLQKSRSAATLMYEVEEDDAEEWKSMEASASSNTYKDHLKEAQARVLQATSFQRRDLEPLGPEAQVLKASYGRIRGRRRFHPAKRTHSFSEPDKIDKVGVDGEPQSGSEQQRKFFETKPSFPRPVLESGHGSNLNPSQDDTSKSGETFPSGGNDQSQPHTDEQSPGEKQVLLEQQRLGTFAEYQATWNKQKKPPDAKTQGRCHSADNILDATAEEKGVCIHERSRSSPSADFYTQISSHWRDPQTQGSNFPARETARLPDRGPVPRSAGVFPGAADHRTKPNLAGSSLSSDIIGPNSEPGPPPSNLGLEPTSSSRELLVCGQPDLTGSAGAAQSICPLPPHWTQLPSPRSAPVEPQEEPQLRSESEPQNPAVMEASGQVRTVPVQIVHSEGSVDRRGQLPQSAESGSPSSLPAEPASPFSTCNRQELEPEPGQEPDGARTLEEDAKRDELARDIMGRDKSLVDILDQSGRRTTMDLMEGLFAPEPVLETVQLRRRPSTGSRPPGTSRREEEDVSVSASLVPSSSYYNTSAPKAELLIKMKDMQEQLDEQDSEDELDGDLASKKQELMSSLARKLAVLREARQSLVEDVEDNEALGRQVDATVRRLCQPNQIDRFRMFVGDLDKVVSLLLSLSGRLARVENALNTLEDGAPTEEKRTLTEKRKLLMRQHDDAKELKENLDRRERLVFAIMEAHLDTENLDDYRHFVKMKSALIIEQRKLDDKIKLGEEQLKCLTESLPLEQRPLPEQRPPPEERLPLAL